MGEYAKYHGEQVKIGTCENMYYLRADQRNEVEGYGFDDEVLGVVRFRFPFPDEDGIEPGAFEDFERGYPVPAGYQLPAKLSGDEHHAVQFTSSAGYVMSIACPEQFSEPGFDAISWVNGAEIHIGRNGFNGGPKVSQQAYRGGKLVTILRCGACGGIHRLDTIADAEPVIEAFATEAARTHVNREGVTELYHGIAGARRLIEIGTRIAAGYGVTVEA